MTETAFQQLAAHKTAQTPAGPVTRLREILDTRFAGQGATFDIAMLGVASSERNGFASALLPAAPENKIPIRLSHSYVVVGPLGAGKPCVNCLERRWLSLRSQIECDALRQASECLIGSSPWLTRDVFEAVAALIAAILASPANDRAPFATVYVLRTPSLRVGRHILMADSGCPSCGDVNEDNAADARIALNPRPKPNPEQYRLRSAASLELPIEALINPICGVLGPGRYLQEDHNFNAKAFGYFRDPDVYHDAVSWGGHTGCVSNSLKVGLMEGLERHSGLKPRSRRTVVYDSLENLGADALDPADSGLYEPVAYEYDRSLTPFRPDLKMHWVWGYSLTENRSILVPSQMIYYGNGHPRDPRFVQDNSNGCATGGCIEEAMLHGLFELIERDAFVIGWYARLSMPRLDPFSSRDPNTLHLLDRAERLNLDIHLIDMRMDIGIPAVMAIVLRRDKSIGTMCVAAGASLNPEDAIRSALGEITSYIVGADERTRNDEPRLREMVSDYDKVRGLRDHALLYGLPEMAEKASFLYASPVVRTVDDAYRGWRADTPLNADLTDDLRMLIGRLAKAGLKQVIAVDQTSPEQRALGVNTASMIVPGLAPLDFGYRCRRAASLQRLYTVPRTAGFAARDLTMADLNPLPHMFP